MMPVSELRIPSLYEARFGVRVALLDAIHADILEAVMEHCRAERVRLLITRCATADLPSVHALESAGFHLMDTLVYYRRSLRIDVPLPLVEHSASVRSATKDDADRVEAIAAAAFGGYSSHFHADPRLDRAMCDAVYTSWARASVLSRDLADEVLVAEMNGTVAGFLTLKFASPETGEGPLIGVAPEFQGLGLGRVLMLKGLDWFQTRGATWMQMSTQVTNTRSQRVWVRLGFEPIHSLYTFHHWFED